MFQFPTFPFICYFTYIWIIRLLPLIEFPHSDIHASTVICTYTWLFAACHVLLRLLMPRHSPYALSSLTFWLRLNFELLRQFRKKCSSYTYVLLITFSAHFLVLLVYTVSNFIKLLNSNLINTQFNVHRNWFRLIS